MDSAPFGSHRHVPGMPPRIVDALHQAWDRLARPGTWWSAGQQLALAGLARSAFAQRTEAPWLRNHDAERARADAAGIEPAARDAIFKLAADARTIDREWAQRSVDAIGDAAYVELVAIAATMAAIDAFAEGLGVPSEPLPDEPLDAGRPSGDIPDGVGDIGAYVDMLESFPGPNVGRALTLCPTGNRLYRDVGQGLYHDGEFLDLAWDRPITRPQAELVATTVSAASECFY